jgi:hypothetical protein
MISTKILVSIGIISIIVFLFTLVYVATTKDTKEGLDAPSPESLVLIPINGVIPDAYYKYDAKYIAPIPYGYYASTDKTQIFPKTLANQWTDIGSKKMDAANGIPTSKNTPPKVDLSKNKYSNDSSSITNTQYHPSDTEIMKQTNGTDISFGNTWIFDMSGNKVEYPSPSTNVQGDILYYTPGSYPFSTANYVPNYEDTIQLSKTTAMSVSTPFNSETKSSGFCNYSKTSPDMVEKSCRALNKDTCATTDCCVLFGGAICVAGNQHGPTQKTNYGDVFIRNKDYYYYRGKCYGNCS